MADSLSRFLDQLGRGGVREDDYADWHALSATQRAPAVAALLDRVTQHDDMRAAITLSRAGVTGAYNAIESLSERVSSSTDRSLLATALARLRPDEPTAIAGLVIALATAESRFARLNAANSLADHPSPASRNALLAALRDTDDLVRAAALKSLTVHAGISGLTHDADGRGELRSPLRVLELRLSNRLESVASPARHHLAGLLAALDAGATPGDLDLVYTPGDPPIDRRAIGFAVAAQAKPLPISDLLASSGHDRAWLDALLLIRLDPTIQDPRAPAALEALGTTGRHAAMAEAIEGLDPDHPLRLAVEGLGTQSG